MQFIVMYYVTLNSLTKPSNMCRIGWCTSSASVSFACIANTFCIEKDWDCCPGQWILNISNWISCDISIVIQDISGWKLIFHLYHLLALCFCAISNVTCYRINIFANIVYCRYLWINFTSPLIAIRIQMLICSTNKNFDVKKKIIRKKNKFQNKNVFTLLVFCFSSEQCQEWMKYSRKFFSLHLLFL